MEKDQFIGRLLDGRYEILEVIGTGGMAVVYKAKCHRLNRMVAIKVLKEEFSQDEEFRSHFRAESQAVAMLSHPNIVSIYDVSSSSSQEYIVTELIDGITLKQYMEKKGVLNWKETLHFATQIAKALEHAHAKGIVHRDIKPHNVMVLKSGAIKVMDFGIAQTLTGEGTKTTEALGSVHYISPEQAKGGRIDNRSDIYSLGVVMYEMITGRVPYDGENPVDIAMQHITGGANPPSTINPATPQGLEQIITRAMSLVPKNRYVTATAMLYDLDAFRKENMKTVPVIPVVEEEITTVAQRQEARRNSGVTPVPRPDLLEDEEENKPSRVTIVAVISCILVGLVAAAVVVVLFVQSGLFDPPEMITVPNLVGQKYETATADGLIIKEVNQQYSDKYPAGIIMAQNPNAGTKVKADSVVSVTVSKGPEQAKTEKMPRVKDLTLNDAKEQLHGLGFYNIIVVYQDSDKAKDTVIAQSVEPLTVVDVADEIVLTVSQGPKLEKMPKVTGMDIEGARIKLNGLGFTNILEESRYSDEPVGKVIAQSVEENKLIEAATQIVLTVSLGPKLEQMPDITGWDLEAAQTLLTELGFQNVILEYQYSDSPEGTILEQSVEKDSVVTVTTEIVLTVSGGPAPELPEQPDDPTVPEEPAE